MKKISLFMLMLFFTLFLKAQLLPGYAVMTTSTDPVVNIYDVNNPPSPSPYGTSERWNRTSIWSVNRNMIGDVFGVALNNDPTNPQIFVASFGMYHDMPVLFPYGSGAIYKIDGTTHGVIRLTNTTTTVTGVGNIGTKNVYQLSNKSRGIGNICYAKFGDLEYLYATNLDDGGIYVIDANSGIVVNVYLPTYTPTLDPGKQSLIGQISWGIAVNNSKLYFARYKLDYFHRSATEHNEIYSVGLSAGIPGGVSGVVQTMPYYTSPTSWLPTPIPLLSYSCPVSDIEFSSQNQMLVAEKSMMDLNNLHFGLANNWAHYSRVYEYSSGSGVLLGSHYVGEVQNGTNTSGGVDYDFNAAGDSHHAGRCGLIFSTADNMMTHNGENLYGFEAIPLAANTQAALHSENVDVDGISNYDPKGQMGDMDILRNTCCEEASAFGIVPTHLCTDEHKVQLYLNIDSRCSNCIDLGSIHWTVVSPSTTAQSSTLQNPYFLFNTPGIYDVTISYSDLCAQESRILHYTIMVENCCTCPLRVTPLSTEYNEVFGTISGLVNISGGSSIGVKYLEMSLVSLNYEDNGCEMNCDEMLVDPSHLGSFVGADDIWGFHPSFENCLGNEYSKEIKWHFPPSTFVSQDIAYTLSVPSYLGCLNNMRYCIKIRVQYDDCSYCDCMFCWDGTSLTCTCNPIISQEKKGNVSKIATENEILKSEIRNSTDGTYTLVMPSSKVKRTINIKNTEGKPISQIVMMENVNQYVMKDLKKGIYQIEIKTGANSENLKVEVTN